MRVGATHHETADSGYTATWRDVELSALYNNNDNDTVHAVLIRSHSRS